MSPVLLAPFALGALAVLAIPVVIHIARRTQTRTVAFAALRWLNPRPKRRRRLRIDERTLLATRLALLAAIVLGLAQPVLRGLADDRPVFAVAPGVDADRLPTPQQENARRIWLAPGFPSLDQALPAGSKGQDVASLIRQLDADLPRGAALELVAPSVLDGVDAERPRLSRAVAWRVVDVDHATTSTPTAPAPPRLTVRYAPDAEPQVRYFRAAATAWTSPELRPAFDAAPIDRPLGSDAGALVWLAPGAPPAEVVRWIRAGGVVLLSSDAVVPLEGEAIGVWRDDEGQPLAIHGVVGKGRVLHLTRPLTPSAMPALLQADFPQALWRLLAPPPEPARVTAVDHAPLTGGPAPQLAPLDVRPWLALIVAALFGVERWLATRRRRAVAP
ncbi:BatA domain-containing protein [Brevundimonas sp.]|uniref:BatA domain-containing protein n=1 Tax=Brevundimonas sp. TaxID=1871086 RepID=UPI0019837902|nr:BatA domain-containing protein [Brevundimonas sp.]MBD3835644.1 BatA domain-containing protein [Brevundimonas sp.]